MLTESRRRDVSTWLGQTRATPRSLTPTADLRLNSQRLNRSSHLRMAADGQRLKRRGSRHPAALKSNHRARNNQTGWELDWDCSYSHPPTPPTWQQSSNRTALSASEQEEENRFSFFTVRFSLRLIARRSKLCLTPQCNTECRSCDLGMSVTGQMSFFKVKSSQNTEQQLFPGTTLTPRRRTCWEKNICPSSGTHTHLGDNSKQIQWAVALRTVSGLHFKWRERADDNGWLMKSNDLHSLNGGRDCIAAFWEIFTGSTWRLQQNWRIQWRKI